MEFDWLIFMSLFVLLLLFIRLVDLSVVSTCQLSDSHKQTYWMSSMAFSFSHSTKTLTFAYSVLSTSLKLPFLKCCTLFWCTMTHLYGSYFLSNWDWDFMLSFECSINLDVPHCLISAAISCISCYGMSYTAVQQFNVAFFQHTWYQPRSPVIAETLSAELFVWFD